jgi:2-polyprenyl-3-methyl-5-hydroxy-6-metoxy-1,4-benzoquinol methylase
MINRYKSYADLLILLQNIKKKRILEMGCGRGRLATFFESIGCDYYAVDASKNMVDTTKKLLYSDKIKAQILNKSFYEIADFNKKFEYIIFEASFHHCGEAVKMLEILQNNTTNDAKIIFLREPIHDWYDRPWGVVRGDPESLLQTRMRGWLELGYRKDFFYELLNKTGWKILESKNIIFENTEIFIAEKIRYFK